jgi:hypothetical protein
MQVTSLTACAGLLIGFKDNNVIHFSYISKKTELSELMQVSIFLRRCEKLWTFQDLQYEAEVVASGKWRGNPGFNKV